MSDRSKYYHEYYLKHKDAKKAQYITRKTYVRYSDIRKMLSYHKKDIGDMAYGLLLDKVYQMDKVRWDGAVRVETGTSGRGTEEKRQGKKV